MTKEQFYVAEITPTKVIIKSEATPSFKMTLAPWLADYVINRDKPRPAKGAIIEGVEITKEKRYLIKQLRKGLGDVTLGSGAYRKETYRMEDILERLETIAYSLKVSPFTPPGYAEALESDIATLSEGEYIGDMEEALEVLDIAEDWQAAFTRE